MPKQNLRACLSILLFSFATLSGYSQIKKNYQGLLWEITGNGLEKPSYLYGTMHVSNRVAFHLGEDFYEAVASADVIALETNPNEWMNQFEESKLYQEYYTMGYRYGNNLNPLYQSFIPKAPSQLELGYYIAQDQDLLNRFLYRLNSEEQDFAEETFLDLFIYQAAKKQGKKVIALEDFEESFVSVMRAGKYDKDAQRISDRQAEEILGDYNNWYELQEDAYRKGDLDLLDTMTSVLNPGKYYRKNMLDVRNRVMADGMDSIMQRNVLFTGVGAAHLPGKMGVINMLREMGYTVKAKTRSITSQSIDKKEQIDKLTYAHQTVQFTTPDGFISTVSPAPLTQLVSFPYQEFVYPDMANGAFYSIRRVSTFGSMYGLTPETYQGKVDSLLFENIPGKINRKEEIKHNGYTAYDIKNTTKKGDKQRYNIVFTPLEVIIIKVGGPKGFIDSEQPTMFFESLQIGEAKISREYLPSHGGYEVELPTKARISYTEGVFKNANATKWTQAVDALGNYYAVGERQLHDFNYLEEDAFELSYLVERIADEEKLTVDTIIMEASNDSALPRFAKFTMLNSKGQKLFGETRKNGSFYVFLVTTDKDLEKQRKYFSSFNFKDFAYANTFETYIDTNVFISLKLPSDPNSYERFFNNLYSSRYGNNERDYLANNRYKTYTYEPTGEQLMMGYEKEHRYRSYSSEKALWENYVPFEAADEFITLTDTLIRSNYSESENYYRATKEYEYGDTGTSNIIRIKAVAENGAIYSLRGQYDKTTGPSKLLQEAFASFAPSGDTLFGSSPFTSKADLFFGDLESKDSAKVYAAKNSYNIPDFKQQHAAKLIDLYENFSFKDFDREDRLGLLNRLAFTDNETYYPYLKDAYYQNIDSADYQFEILETLLDYNTEQGNELFAELILDEPPFTGKSYGYSNLFREFNDSLENASVVFPDILELTDFEDYKAPIYTLLRTLVDSSLIKPRLFKQKRNTILRYAKVAYKKQRASEDADSKASSNYKLTKFNAILQPYGNRRDVREHYTNLLSLKNKNVLMEQIPYVYEHIEIPEKLWNTMADNDAARGEVYTFLKKRGKLNLLDNAHKTQQALAASMIQTLEYGGFDSLEYVGIDEAESKLGTLTVYFFKVQDEDDNFWQLAYAAVPKKENEVFAEAEILKLGERFNPKADDVEKVMHDALQKVRLYNRERVVEENSYRRY